MIRKTTLATFTAILFATIFLSAAPSAHAQQCSLAGVAGKWGYTYTGTLILPTGTVPVAAVGRFTLDAAGNLSGAQTRSNGGISSQETITAKITVNADCSGTRQLQRLAAALCIMNGWGIPKVPCRVATENRVLR